MGRPEAPDAAQLLAWLRQRVAEIVDLPQDRVDGERSFADYGLSSTDAVGLSGDLEELLGRELSPTLLWEHPTPAELAAVLAGGEEPSDGAANAPAVGAVDEPIAIVGIGCRFPGARGPRDFWRLLWQGEDSVTEVPTARWDAASLFAAEPGVPGRSVSRWGGFVDDVACFDAAFFGISPAEADRMDPQHRLLLEVTWEALEDAAIGEDRLRGSDAGVFVGLSTGDYGRRLLADLDGLDAYTGTGSSPSLAANRISHLLGLHGPSLVVDTACSSSLVAAHVACRSLREGETSLALVGGVNVLLSPAGAIIFSHAGLLARDGRCKVFDARADGYVRGEGVGVVVLERLGDALSAGDPVYAVIRGGAVNQDGPSNGLTAPNPAAQEALLRAAYRRAERRPAEVVYVEAHGTGTPLGDRIETTSLGAVLGEGRAPDRPCLVGSVKSNLGHLEAAAGIAGLIKAALVLHHRKVPPSLHYESPNPQIPFDRLPLRVAREGQELAADGRLAGVSSFGFGGTNAHLVLEAAPDALDSPPDTGSAEPASAYLLPVAARSEDDLERLGHRLADALEEAPDLGLADVAHTLQRRRNRLPVRRALLCRDRAGAVAALRGEERRDAVTVRRPAASSPPPLAFLLPGLGNHYAGMAWDLYRGEPEFRGVVDHGAEVLRHELGEDLRQILYPPQAEGGAGGGAGAVADGPAAGRLDLRALLGRDPAAEETVGDPLRATRRNQPALFLVELALARLLVSWGLEPAAMIGYSLGEYVAACLAGVFGVDDALRLVARRAALVEALPAGTMLAVPLSAQRVEGLLSEVAEDLALGAVSGPALCVVSGPDAAITALEERLAQDDVATRRLDTAHPFHSPHMEPVRDELRRLVAQVPRRPPSIPFVSNVTGDWITAGEATDPDYWARHLCETVRFDRGLETVLGERRAVLLEVGPGQALSSFVMASAQAAGRPVFPTLRDRHLREDDRTFLLRTVGRLWAEGVEMDWTARAAAAPRQVVPLPTYPFAGRRHWLPAEDQGMTEPASSAAVATRSAPPANDGDGRLPTSAWHHLPTWRGAPPPRRGSWEGQRVLLLTRGAGPAEVLADALRVAGAEVLTVIPGERFAPRGEAGWTLPPRDGEAWSALVAELDRTASETGTVVDRVIHAWCLGDCDPGGADGEEGLGFYALLLLARALAVAPGPFQLTVVASGVCEVTGGDPLIPERALLLGPVRVLPLEAAGVTARLLDLPAGPAPDPAEVAGWLAEIAAGADPEAPPVVAWRGRRRWLEELVPDPLDAPPEAASGAASGLRRKGTYLVTGGPGSPGPALARELARSRDARVVLLAAGDDGTGLSDGAGGNGQGAGETGQGGWKDAQGAVVTLSADPADGVALVRAVEEVRRRFGPVDGVLHAAEVHAPALLELTAVDDAARVLAPKVAGTRALAAPLGNGALANGGFLALVSSTAALVGAGPGSAAATAAAAYLDAFALAASATGRRVVAVDWADWSWSASGRTPDEELGGLGGDLRRELERDRELYGIGAAEAVDRLDRILAADRSRSVVSPRSPQRLLQAARRLTAERLAGVGAVGNGRGRHPRPTLAVEYVAPRGAVEERIAEIWSEVLSVERVGVHDNFFDLGGHSLLGAQIFRQLRSSFDVELPLKTLFDARTVAALADLVESCRWTAGTAAAAAGTLDGDREEGEI